MTSTQRVTKAQATAVLRAVENKYSGYLMDFARGADGKYDFDAPMVPATSGLPELVENYQYSKDSEPCWAIVWEDGPFEWACRDLTYATIDEETTALARDEGADVTCYNPAVKVPVKVLCEAIYTYVLGIYPL